MSNLQPYKHNILINFIDYTLLHNHSSSHTCRFRSIILNFNFLNGKWRYKYLGQEEVYFEKEHSDPQNKYTNTMYSKGDIIKMLEI